MANTSSLNELDISYKLTCYIHPIFLLENAWRYFYLIFLAIVYEMSRQIEKESPFRSKEPIEMPINTRKWCNDRSKVFLRATLSKTRWSISFPQK